MSDQHKPKRGENRERTDLKDVPEGSDADTDRGQAHAKDPKDLVSGTGPAQPDRVQQPEGHSGPARTQSGTPDQPGAAGGSSARADEDTYD